VLTAGGVYVRDRWNDREWRFFGNAEVFCRDVIYKLSGYYFIECDKTREETWSDPGPGQDRSRGSYQNKGRVLALISERLALEFCSGNRYVC
jgi:hypothetical protein